MLRLATLYSLFCLVFLLAACHKNDLSPEDSPTAFTACGVKDPVKELSWLKEMVRKAESAADKGAYAGTIQLVHYQNQPYFIYQRYIMSCMACEVYSCQGDKLDILSKPDLHMAIIEGMSEKNIIYRSPFN